MKKIFTLMVVVAGLLLSASTHAQGIYQLWGTTTAGGKDDIGTFFSTKYDGTAQQVKPFFNAANSGRSAEQNQPVEYNGKFYSLLAHGGIDDAGIISEYDPATNIYTTRVNFFDVDLGAAGNALVLLGNKLYGVTTYYSANAPSCLFEFNPASGVITKKHIFTNASGIGLSHEPTAFNNKLYGSTFLGGNNDAGVIYEYDPATSVYTIKHHFTAAMPGENGVGFTIYANKLWGISGNGMIYSFDPANNTLTPKQNISAIGSTGTDGRMAVLNNKMYGISRHGGVGDEGFIFEYNPVNNVLNMEFDFTASTVNNRFSLVAHNGLLYGASIFGALNDQGALFSYDPVANDYSVLKTFNDASGGRGMGRLLVYNNNLYGWLLKTAYPSGKSSLFEYKLASNQFGLKISLAGGELGGPVGELLYYKNKLYGSASRGGDLFGGGIYSFNLQTQAFETKINMAETSGRFLDQGGFVLHNDKFYGVTSQGGINGKGTLFEYDPNSNAYTSLFDFGGSSGDRPFGKLVSFNGKLYGTCNSGSTSDEGSIFEYNPATNSLLTKVAFDGTRGGGPRAGLTVHNGRIFGVAGHGGSSNHGTLFEYLPLPNALVKLADFKNDVTGSEPVSPLLVYNNKLWGVTHSSFAGSYIGDIYEFDIATGILSKKRELTPETGQMALAGMTLVNNKMYGMTTIGGSGYLDGVLFEYDPANNNYTVKTDFEPLNGKWARRTELAKAPAPTAPGSPNSCTNTQTININAANANEWIAFTDAQGRAVAEINANGNILGNTAVRVFVNGGNTRQHASGFFYLDRNITISPANQPATPVSIRLYIKKTEFDALKATAGSGVNVPADISIFRNNDFCTPSISSTTTALATVKTDWGFDYVYSAETTSFSSFYFASNLAVLPVKMLYFNGATEAIANRLNWKTVCTNAVDFIIERSTDGIHFDSIGINKAQQIDCNVPFVFKDEAPAALSYYRIKMLEDNAAISYSAIVVLERKGNHLLNIVLMPNPVIGSEAKLQITSSKIQQLPIKLFDATGRNILNTSVQLATGVQNFSIQLPSLSAGVYYLQCGDANDKQLIKLLKQ